MSGGPQQLCVLIKALTHGGIIFVSSNNSQAWDCVLASGTFWAVSQAALAEFLLMKSAFGKNSGFVGTGRDCSKHQGFGCLLMWWSEVLFQSHPDL